MILVGVVVGAIAMFVTLKIMFLFFREKSDGTNSHWNPALDETR